MQTGPGWPGLKRTSGRFCNTGDLQVLFKMAGEGRMLKPGTTEMAVPSGDQLADFIVVPAPEIHPHLRKPDIAVLVQDNLSGMAVRVG